MSLPVFDWLENKPSISYFEEFVNPDLIHPTLYVDLGNGNNPIRANLTTIKIVFAYEDLYKGLHQQNDFSDWGESISGSLCIDDIVFTDHGPLQPSATPPPTPTATQPPTATNTPIPTSTPTSPSPTPSEP